MAILTTDLRGKRIALVGFGLESIALARFAAGEGTSAISVTDKKTEEQLAGAIAQVADLPVPVKLYAGANDPAAWADADVIFVSPGITPGFAIRIPGIAEAAARGAVISNHTQLFFERSPAPIIAITGSAGKTTTTNLVHEMLQASGHRRIWFGGNMGIPLINEVSAMTPADLVVLELSEVQLARLHASPHIGIITNITPDHLDRYGTFAEYVRAKRQMVRAMQPADYAILSYDNQPARESATETKAQTLYFSRTSHLEVGADVRDGAFWVRLPDQAPQRLAAIDEMQLIGDHNVENILAAALAASLGGATPTAIATTIRTFGGVAHRLQFIAERAGVRYYSDSMATAPTRMLAALHAFTTPILLIAGGKNKDLPWEDAAREIVRRVRVVALLGVSAPMIREAIQAAQAEIPRAEQQLERIVSVTSVEEAVDTLAALAHAGDVVLLSPGCASHDMFIDYADRGQHFIDAVLER